MTAVISTFGRSWQELIEPRPAWATKYNLGWGGRWSGEGLSSNTTLQTTLSFSAKDHEAKKEHRDTARQEEYRDEMDTLVSNSKSNAYTMTQASHLWLSTLLITKE